LEEADHVQGHVQGGTGLGLDPDVEVDLDLAIVDQGLEEDQDLGKDLGHESDQGQPQGKRGQVQGKKVLIIPVSLLNLKYIKICLFNLIRKYQVQQ
jgi:hypothetical protein